VIWSVSNCKEVIRNIFVLVAASIVFARVILFVESWERQFSSCYLVHRSSSRVWVLVELVVEAVCDSVVHNV
jgi:hypothetical protein